MSEWIEWGGGKCPVHPDTVVECKYGRGDFISKPLEACRHVWKNLPGSPELDIIAYRIVKPAYEGVTPLEISGGEQTAAVVAPSPYATIMRGFAAQHSCALACITVNEMKGEIL